MTIPINYRWFSLTAATLLLLAACNSDDTEMDYSLRPLKVIVDGGTRSSAITTETLSSFSMNYGANKYDAQKSGSEWNTVPDSWPNSVGNDDMIDFYAYTGGTFNQNSGNPYLSFTANGEAASTQDLLIAHVNTSYNTGYKGTKGAVKLTFDHACAAVDFTINSTKTDPVTIREIVLNNVRRSGQYSYQSGWNDADAGTIYSNYALYSAPSGGFSLTKGAEPYALPAVHSSCGTLFFIPQTLSTVLVRYTISGANKKTTITLNKPVKAGDHYNINLELSQN